MFPNTLRPDFDLTEPGPSSLTRVEVFCGSDTLPASPPTTALAPAPSTRAIIKRGDVPPPVASAPVASASTPSHEPTPPRTTSYERAFRSWSSKRSEPGTLPGVAAPTYEVYCPRAAAGAAPLRRADRSLAPLPRPSLLARLCIGVAAAAVALTTTGIVLFAYDEPEEPVSFTPTDDDNDAVRSATSMNALVSLPPSDSPPVTSEPLLVRDREVLRAGRPVRTRTKR